MKKLLLLLAQTLMLLCIALPSIVFAAKDSAPIAEMKYDGKTATTLHYRDLSVTADIQTAQDPTACANASDVGKSSCKTIVVTGTAGGKAAFTFDVPNDVDSLDMLNVDVTLRRLDPASALPQVIVSYPTGGNDCSGGTQLFTENSDGEWRSIAADYGRCSTGVGFVNVKGVDGTMIVAGDDGFRDALFASMACSFAPTEVFLLQGDRLVDVSRDPAFRPLSLRYLHELEQQQKEQKCTGREINGYLAGWVAQSALAGQLQSAWQTMLADYDHTPPTEPFAFGITYCRVAVRDAKGMCPDMQRIGVPYPEALAIFLTEHAYVTQAEAKSLGYDVPKILAERKARIAAATAEYKHQLAEGVPPTPAPYQGPVWRCSDVFQAVTGSDQDFDAESKWEMRIELQQIVRYETRYVLRHYPQIFVNMDAAGLKAGAAISEAVGSYCGDPDNLDAPVSKAIDAVIENLSPTAQAPAPAEDHEPKTTQESAPADQEPKTTAGPVATDIAVLALTCTPTSVGPEIQGEIKNISSRPLKDVYITPTFWDTKGGFMSVATDVPASFNPILPGQTSTFDGYGDSNPAIAKVTIAPVIMEGPALASSGIRSAPCTPYQKAQPHGSWTTEAVGSGVFGQSFILANLPASATSDGSNRDALAVMCGDHHNPMLALTWHIVHPETKSKAKFLIKVDNEKARVFDAVREGWNHWRYAVVVRGPEVLPELRVIATAKRSIGVGLEFGGHEFSDLFEAPGSAAAVNRVIKECK